MRKFLPIVSENLPCRGDCPQRPALATEMATQLELARRAPRRQPRGDARNDTRNDTAPGDRYEAMLDLRVPLPLATPLARRAVQQWHVWIAVARAALIVLDEADHQLMRQLVAGLPPAAVLAAENPVAAACPTSASVTSDLGPAAGRLARLVGRLAWAGLLHDMTGVAGGEARLDPARSVRLHLTRACQLRCVHCYADSSPQIDRREERPTAWWLDVLKNLKQLGTERVLFTGGEALMHPGCLDLMAAARSDGMHVTLFTNGLLIERVLDRLVEVCDEVQVSVDGPTPEVNDAIRGRNVFAPAVRALGLLARSPLKTRVGMTAMSLNWDAWQSGFAEFADRFADSGDLSFHLAPSVTEYGRAANKQHLSQPRLRRIDIAQVLAGRPGTPAKPECTRRVSRCGYFEQLVIGPDGSLYPCHLFDAAVGHADDQSLSAWVSDYCHLAEQFSIDHVDGCTDCELRYLCGGTCRAVAAQTSGSRLRSDCTPADKERRYQDLVLEYAPTS